MDLTLKISGQRCDLALHPVSQKTVERIQALGRKFYAQKYIHWWRNGNTSTCGMKFDDDCMVQVSLDDNRIPFDTSVIPESAVFLRRRHFVESKARYLALLGYDDEFCNMTWKWTDHRKLRSGQIRFLRPPLGPYPGHPGFSHSRRTSATTAPLPTNRTGAAVADST